MNNKSHEQFVREYLDIVDAVYGVYLDSTLGFKKIRDSFEENQKQGLIMLRNQGNNIGLEDLDKARIFYGKGNPNLPESYTLHVTTQAEYKKRNEEGGENYRTIGNLCLVQIYQFWEDHYRDKIAQALGVDRNELKSDIMGDLRLFRNSIIHHRGVAQKDIEKCKLLKWFHHNDKIFIQKDEFELVVFYVKTEIKALFNL